MFADGFRSRGEADDVAHVDEDAVFVPGVDHGAILVGVVLSLADGLEVFGVDTFHADEGEVAPDARGFIDELGMRCAWVSVCIMKRMAMPRAQGDEAIEDAPTRDCAKVVVGEEVERMPRRSCPRPLRGRVRRGGSASCGPAR